MIEETIGLWLRQTESVEN